ncbi:hypothetical protein BpHYR1_005257 [Brachionus plicatilis]|uniref:Uncharacterized protein n=1 Tax=Brachionus plicatilis TaxID=10195 RepID=A0A3M7Q1T8_BRAPC|nr:hypothetical protein BpHYR1_005257 [Brachionus plicatilis]
MFKNSGGVSFSLHFLVNLINHRRLRPLPFRHLWAPSEQDCRRGSKTRQSLSRSVCSCVRRGRSRP